MGNTFNEFFEEQMKDPKFRAGYELLQPEGAVTQAVIDARTLFGITQKHLSKKTGIAQGDISKIETGEANPSIKTLQRLAAGMNMKLKIEFIPISNEDADLMLSSLNEEVEISEPIPEPISRAI